MVFGGWLHGRLARTVNVLRETPSTCTNPIVFALAVMVLVSGMRSMQELVIMSYALVAWWAANRLSAQARSSPDDGEAAPRRVVVPAGARYGGTIVSVHGLCRALAARGHDVHVYTTSVDGPRDSAVRAR